MQTTKSGSGRRGRAVIGRVAWALLVQVALSAGAWAGETGPADEVNPFIGTGGHGHTFPGATVPFGMVQLSPDTRLSGWDGCSGYHWSDDRIFGFSHTHLSGTGVGDYGDVLLYPAIGPVKWESGWRGEPDAPVRDPRPVEEGYGSRFDKQSESATAGYYAVTLAESGVRVELTATARAGMHRYTFPAGSDAHILIDLTHRDEVLSSQLRVESETEISGYRVSRAWAAEQRVYFVAQFSQAFQSTIATDGIERPGLRLGHGATVKAALRFTAKKREPVLVKVGLSAVSVENARLNLEGEIADWDFERVRAEARAAWNQALGRVELEGATPTQRRIFYTALYHTLIQPNLYTDRNGEYRGRDGQVHRAEGWTQYTVFSLWDTFRAAHPLYTLLEPARTVDFIRTFLAQYREGGLLPVWELAANETMCMIGYHSASVIADAHARGIRDFDAAAALEAMVASASRDHLGLDVYREKGYIPNDRESESVSKTLEYAYDDWCIASLAAELGREEIAREFARRSRSWRNLLDPQTRFMRPKAEGRWKSPFDPSEVDFNFTEANSWQYSFFVPQDIPGLIEALGGTSAATARLDSLFGASSATTGRKQADITGLIGQYAHGNEPSHHMAYLYASTGQPAKTQARVRQILTELYAAAPDGLSGNEDCGQMSAWYVLSALGIYPVTPGTDLWVIGSPLHPRATLELPNGRRFTVEAENHSAGPYIQSASLNGTPLTRTWLGHHEIEAGGTLRFVMGASPSSWGANEPPPGASSRWDDADFVPVPYVARGDTPFRERTTVELASPRSDARIIYTLDGSEPRGPATLAPNRDAPSNGSMSIPLETTTTIRYRAYARDEAASPIEETTFRKIEDSRRLIAATAPSPQYPGGTPEALIDGVRGGPDFRLGAWQGFEGKNLSAEIDLGREIDLTRVAIGCLQDQNSWIFMPTRLTVEISLDGQSYRPLGEVKNFVDPRAEGPIGQELSVRAIPFAIPTRYVRLTAESLQRCPDWHKGAGNPCWIFIDEVIVE
ncbi:MAG: GH92 family glycosyl hydrolase [Candidatus Eisenbacteria bacterium]|nr:GH92 family glycosyl hydrolase [Candidatus Eisenbacteria bacterium]